MPVRWLSMPGSLCHDCSCCAVGLSMPAVCALYADGLSMPADAVKLPLMPHRAGAPVEIVPLVRCCRGSTRIRVLYTLRLAMPATAAAGRRALYARGFCSLCRWALYARGCSRVAVDGCCSSTHTRALNALRLKISQSHNLSMSQLTIPQSLAHHGRDREHDVRCVTGTKTQLPLSLSCVPGGERRRFSTCGKTVSWETGPLLTLSAALAAFAANPRLLQGWSGASTSPPIFGFPSRERRRSAGVPCRSRAVGVPVRAPLVAGVLEPGW